MGIYAKNLPIRLQTLVSYVVRKKRTLQGDFRGVEAL